MLKPILVAFMILQTQLPLQLIKKNIKDMEVGDYGYAYAGAMQIDGDGKCYLNPQETVSRRMSPVLASIKIHRSELGFRVELLDSTYQWDKSDDLKGWLPVIEFKIRK